MRNTQRKSFALAFVAVAALLLLAAPRIGRAQSSSPATATATASADALLAEGEQIFTSVCVACHQPGGKGVAGIYPALAGDPFVKLEDPRPMVSTVLNGRGGMPRFASSYTDEQTAAVVSYVRGTWGNDALPVSPDYVAKVRASFVATPVTGTPTVTTEQDPHGNR